MLSEMGEGELREWMRARLKGYSLKELHLRTRKDDEVPYQVPKRARFQTPEKLAPAVVAALRPAAVSTIASWSPPSASIFSRGSMSAA